jgi:hypothetical protein
MNSMNKALATAMGINRLAQPPRSSGATRRGRSAGGATLGSTDAVSEPTDWMTDWLFKDGDRAASG